MNEEPEPTIEVDPPVEKPKRTRRKKVESTPEEQAVLDDPEVSAALQVVFDGTSDSTPRPDLLDEPADTPDPEPTAPRRKRILVDGTSCITKTRPEGDEQ